MSIGLQTTFEGPSPSSDPSPTAVPELLAANEAQLDYFPRPFVKAFTALKRHEIAKAREANADYGSDDWHNGVTDWERGQFLRLA